MLRHALTCSLLLLATVDLAAQTLPPPAPTGCYTNPVLPGFYPDPSLVRVGEDYYLVNSTFQYFPAIAISHSRDLVHWRQIGHVFPRPGDLELDPFFDGCGIWAPDISWHDGTFYVFYCLVQLKKDRSVNVRGNYMVKSANILGPWSKPVQLTPDGNDPSHFVDDDGSHYICHAAGLPKGSATKIAKLSPDCTRVVEGPFWIDYGGEKRAPEGPHLFKKDGWYYHTMAASGGIYDGHHQLIARSRSVYGPYEPSPHNPFIAQLDPQAAIQHQGHAKLVQTQHGDWWVLYLCQRRIDGFSQLGRETGLDKVDWLADGWPVLNAGKGPSYSSPLPALPPAPAVNPASDTFDAPSFGLQWLFVRNPDTNAVSLTAHPGALQILAGPRPLHDPLAKSILLQREISQIYTAATTMRFEPRHGESAGLLCYYDTASYAALGLTGSNGVQRLRLDVCRKGKRETLADLPRSGRGPIGLRVRVNGLARVFEASDDGNTWFPVGTLDKASFLSDQGTPNWGFMGTLVGLFAADNGSGQTVPALFDEFRHEPGQKGAAQ